MATDLFTCTRCVNPSLEFNTDGLYDEKYIVERLTGE